MSGRSVYVASRYWQDPRITTMVEPHTPTSFKDSKSPILVLSVDDEVAMTQEFFGETNQPLHKPIVHPSLSRLHNSKTKIVT